MEGILHSIGALDVSFVIIFIGLVGYFHNRLGKIEDNYVTKKVLEEKLESSIDLVSEKINEIKKILDNIIVYKIKED